MKCTRLPLLCWHGGMYRFRATNRLFAHLLNIQGSFMGQAQSVGLPKPAGIKMPFSSLSYACYNDNKPHARMVLMARWYCSSTQGLEGLSLRVCTVVDVDSRTYTERSISSLVHCGQAMQGWMRTAAWISWTNHTKLGPAPQGISTSQRLPEHSSVLHIPCPLLLPQNENKGIHAECTVRGCTVRGALCIGWGALCPALIEPPCKRDLRLGGPTESMAAQCQSGIQDWALDL